MEIILSQLNNSVPGLGNSAVCDNAGRVLARVFSAEFARMITTEDLAELAVAASCMKGSKEQALSLVQQYKQKNVLVKSMEKGVLLLFFDGAIDTQVLNITLNFAVRKLNILYDAHAANISAVSIDQTSGTSIRRDGKGVILTVDTMKAAAIINWNQMEEVAAIGSGTAEILKEISGASSIKKLKLNNRVTGTSRSLKVVIIGKGENCPAEGRIVMTLAAIESIHVKPGDQITTEAVIGGGFFS